MPPGICLTVAPLVRCRSTPRLLRQAITLHDVWLAAQHEVSRPDIKAVLVVRIDTKKCRTAAWQTPTEMDSIMLAANSEPEVPLFQYSNLNEDSFLIQHLMARQTPIFDRISRILPFVVAAQVAADPNQRRHHIKSIQDGC
ncbi:predicted protein [Histoplasma capsulatum H143]|uniref:Uncharacterized protein n=1 Tax=Ajellomyces capsulatus (strain H143) TaxID=544712 RepID=C6HE78_AJECH|nr:predicted protein [Histoplasma capsulatum H143]